VPKYFVSSLAQDLVGEISEIPSFPVVEMYEVKWHTENTQSCIYHLMKDEPELAATFCQFSARKQIIEPTYIRLKKGIFILVNYTDVKVICPQGSTYNLTNTKCHPCLVRLQCGCELHAEGQTLVAASSRCLRHERLGPKLLHGINLILLQSFYDLNNWTLSAKNLLEVGEYREPKDMHWKIYSENVTKILASDQQDSYSLKKLTETFQNGSYALHSPAEALLFDFLHEYTPRQKFWYLNLKSWTTYALLILYLLSGSFHCNSIQKLSAFKNFTGGSSTKHSTFTKSSRIRVETGSHDSTTSVSKLFGELNTKFRTNSESGFLLVALWISTIIVASLS
jgi:hypothetical protein